MLRALSLMHFDNDNKLMHNKNICLLKSVCMLSTVIVIINIQHLDLRESAMVVITLFHTFHSYAWKAKYVDEANNGQWSTLLSVGNELMWCRNTRITSLQYIHPYLSY